MGGLGHSLVYEPTLIILSAVIFLAFLFSVKTTDYINLFIKSRKAKGLSMHSIRWYQEILKRFANKYELLPQKPEVIEEFLASCKAGDERKHGYYRTLRAMYSFLNKRFNIDNPIKKMDPPIRRRKLPNVLMPDELDQLLSFPHKPRRKAALIFLIDTGCRIGELVNLTPSDFNETPWGYVVRVTGKTGTRLLPLSYHAYKAIIPVLPFNITAQRMTRLISWAFQDAHVKGTAHTLRHTFATLWKGDTFALQRIMGHKHISTTEMYRHLQVDYLIEQHHQFSPLLMLLSRSKSML